MCSHWHAEAFLTEAQLAAAILTPPGSVPSDASDKTEPDVCFTVVPKVSDLSISKADSSDPVLTGEGFTYTLVAHNEGPDDDNVVTVTDALPSGVTLDGTITTTQGTCSESGGTVTCELGEMLPGAANDVTIAIPVKATGAGTYSNTATIEGESDDNDPSNNSDTETTTVNPVADLSIAKSAAPDPVQTGQTITYTLTAHNAGPDTDPGVTVTDPLPGNVTYVSSSTTQGSCSESLGTVTCNVGAVPPGAINDVVITITVTAGSAGTATNTASVAGQASDPNSGNNSDTETTQISPATQTVPFKVIEMSINKSKPKKGGFPVAFLSVKNPDGSVAFDATTIVPATVCVFEQGTNPEPNPPCGLVKSAVKDVNGDGVNDLQLWFNSELVPMSTGTNKTICGRGTTTGGQTVRGCASGIKVV
jgi:uncharacterized repeat protein (TIGR01451 family)